MVCVLLFPVLAAEIIVHETIRGLLRPAAAELIGSALFLFLACGSAMTTTGYQVKGVSIIGIAMSFGFTIFVMCYTIGHISGGHLNFAVTFTFCLLRKISILKCGLYFLAQFLGGLVGIGFLKLVTPTEWWKSCFAANVVQSELTVGHAFVAEFILTFMLMWVVMAACDSSKSNQTLVPLAIGMAVFIAHMIAIPITGCSINPTRTFASAAAASGVTGCHPWADQWVFWVSHTHATHSCEQAKLQEASDVFLHSSHCCCCGCCVLFSLVRSPAPPLPVLCTSIASTKEATRSMHSSTCMCSDTKRANANSAAQRRATGKRSEFLLRTTRRHPAIALPLPFTFLRIMRSLSSALPILLLLSSVLSIRRSFVFCNFARQLDLNISVPLFNHFQKVATQSVSLLRMAIQITCKTNRSRTRTTVIEVATLTSQASCALAFWRPPRTPTARLREQSGELGPCFRMQPAASRPLRCRLKPPEMP